MRYETGNLDNNKETTSETSSSKSGSHSVSLHSGSRSRSESPHLAEVEAPATELERGEESSSVSAFFYPSSVTPAISSSSISACSLSEHRLSATQHQLPALFQSQPVPADHAAAASSTITATLKPRRAPMSQSAFLSASGAQNGENGLGDTTGGTSRRRSHPSLQRQQGPCARFRGSQNREVVDLRLASTYVPAVAGLLRSSLLILVLSR